MSGIARATDDVARSLREHEVRDMVRSMGRGAELTRVQALAADAALARCDGPR